MPYQINSTTPQWSLDVAKFEEGMAYFGQAEGIEDQEDYDEILANPTEAQQLAILKVFAKSFTVSPPPP